MVTPVQDWQPQTEEVTLPSGRIARLKRPDPVDIILQDGKIPDVLSNMMLEAIATGGQVSKTEFDLNAETLPQILQMLNVIAAGSFVEPRAVLGEHNIPANAISVSWLSFNDRIFVFGWAMGAQFQPAATFPEQPDGSLESVPPVADLRPEAE